MCSKVGVSSDIDGFDCGNDAFHTNNKHGRKGTDK